MNSESPTIMHDVAALRAAVAAARRDGLTIGLAPTMGALHAGHASLVDAARRECGFVVVSIFVNPTQFAPSEDFQKYPRTLDADVALLARHGAHLVFAPPAEAMYLPGHATTVEVSSVAEPLEGERRPGHFRGVATVVAKLLNQVQPDIAYFGQKDYQQTLVVRRMAADLDFPVAIRVCPTVRDADGLALSSRNAYLSAEERRQALVINRALTKAEQWARAGASDVEPLRRALLDELATEPAVALEYLAIADAQTLAPLVHLDRPAVVAIAAKVGSTRLIDNTLLPEPG